MGILFLFYSLQVECLSWTAGMTTSDIVFVLCIAWVGNGTYWAHYETSGGMTFRLMWNEQPLFKTWISDAQHCLFLENADQNYNEITPPTGQNGHHQKVYKQ